MMDNASKKRKDGAWDEIQTTVPVHKNQGKSLVLLLVNYRSIYSKALEFWNLVDTYNPDMIIGRGHRLERKQGTQKYFGRTARRL